MGPYSIKEGVYAASYDEAMNTLADPLFPVYQNGLMGYIDETGRAAIPLSFTGGQGFMEGLAAVHTGRTFAIRDTESRWGYIDATGQYIIQPKFQMPKITLGRIDIHFSEGFAAGANGQKCGYIEQSGEYCIDPIFDACAAFSEGLAIVQEKRHYGCINARGELQIPFQPHLLFGFNQGRAQVLVDGKYGFVDAAGGEVIPPVWSGQSLHPCAYGFHEGLAAVESGSKVGFVDVTGEIAIPLRPTGITESTQQLDGFVFSEGLAAFAVQGSWGYIDRNCAFVIDPVYQAAGAFSEGLAAVYSDGLWRYIDSHGSVRFTVPGQDREKTVFPDGSYTMHCGRFKHRLAPINILAGDFGVPSHLGYVDSTGRYVWAPSS